jgi:uncharacterized protein (DUF2235 family)
MAKNIVICLDGTWNGVDIGEDDKVSSATNVLRTYLELGGEPTLQSIPLSNEMEKEALDDKGEKYQVAKYLHGVGDSDNKIVSLLGGAFGAGIVSRIVRAYTYISRKYEQGDDIFIIGFSRGAYTARALGGMICKEGLLNYAALKNPTKEEAYEYGVSVWGRYRKSKMKQMKATGFLLSIWEEYVHKGRAIADSQLIQNVEIKAIAVWDTVGSLGIPVVQSDTAVDVFRFADNSLNTKVKNGIHAISLDEQRVTFTPTLWEVRDGVEQVWFCGAHADVGGGYPASEIGLSEVTREWMQGKLSSQGLKFKSPSARRIEANILADGHEPWTTGIFAAGSHAPRGLPNDAMVHTSVKDRRAKVKGYEPTAFGSIKTWVGKYV